MSNGFPRVQLARMIWAGFQNIAYCNYENKSLNRNFSPFLMCHIEM